MTLSSAESCLDVLGALNWPLKGGIFDGRGGGGRGGAGRLGSGGTCTGVEGGGNGGAALGLLEAAERLAADGRAEAPGRADSAGRDASRSVEEAGRLGAV